MDLVYDSLRRPSYVATLVTVFALLSGLLSLVAIYGVMSYFVHQHRRDIGIRLALGGAPRVVVGSVLADGMRPVVVGVVTGVLGALLVTRFLSGLLYDLRPTDPTTFALVAAGTFTAALTTCYLPARRAARVDPGDTLREE